MKEESDVRVDALMLELRKTKEQRDKLETRVRFLEKALNYCVFVDNRCPLLIDAESRWGRHN